MPKKVGLICTWCFQGKHKKCTRHCKICAGKCTCVCHG